MAKESIKTLNIADLVPDDKNFNRGTEYGGQLLERSFEKFGAGRSILLDKNNRIIAGNKASEKYGALGGEDVLVVETDGTKLVAVKRTDIDLDSREGRELALADNATQKADLEWDEGTIADVAAEWDINPDDWGVEMADTELPKEAVEDDFNEAEDEIHVRCKLGDFWQLGDHRLMCGDSTDLETVKKLMGGGRQPNDN